MRVRGSAIRRVLPLAAAMLGILACERTNARNSQAPATEAGPPLVVEISRPVRGTVVRRLDAVATLEPWEEAVLYAKASGYLKSIRVDRGDRVRKGRLLAVLDIPEMQDEQAQLQAQAQQAKAEVEKAEAEVRLQEITLNRLRAVLEEEPGAVTEQEVDLASGKLEASRAALAAAGSRLLVVRADLSRLETLLAYSRITAPFDGSITERFVDPGALVTAGTGSKPSPIVRIVNASKLRAMVDVPETDAARVHEGSAASLRVDALPGRAFQGTVSRFSRALDPATRTMRTEVLIANPDGILVPGMFGRIALELERLEHVLTLAPAHLHFEKERAHVFVADDGRARRVSVVCGADDGNAIEIVSGLTGGEAIISKASGPLSDGVPIRLADSSPAGGGGGP
ncbi:MAG: efflux RND transporter periplasmic adaptor subunit [Acidobacteria bacterium]|nr:efflux RND transporter periplasmic adaptor subunit [Acidobacteriota bacterium]